MMGLTTITANVEADTEDGISIYKVEFRHGKTEYEYEIEAATGRILDWESEEEDD